LALSALAQQALLALELGQALVVVLVALALALPLAPLSLPVL
jgi:hypothetical protein